MGVSVIETLHKPPARELRTTATEEQLRNGQWNDHSGLDPVLLPRNLTPSSEAAPNYNDVWSAYRYFTLPVKHHSVTVNNHKFCGKTQQIEGFIQCWSEARTQESHNRTTMGLTTDMTVKRQPAEKEAYKTELRKHAYSNILKISPPKKWKFSDKKTLIFSNFCSKHK